MEFNDKGEFKVGNTTLSTPIKIRIPEYGYELPEIHSSSPISMPIYVKVAYIINWLERGINIDFCGDKGSTERVFFFVMEYNRYVQEENKKIEDIESHYRPALNAQARLYRTIDFKNYLETKKENETIPFKVNPFKGIPSNNEAGSNNDNDRIYQNPLKSKNKKSKDVLKVPYEKPITPDEVYAYDAFEPIREAFIAEHNEFDDVELK
jgi:hypothetical protein